MGLIEGIQSSFRLFGYEGLLLVSKARLLQRPVEIVTTIAGAKHPIHLRLRTSDVSVLHQVFLINEYERELSRPPRTIVDAGANIGLTAVFYANQYPDAEIIAIEPESSNFALLEKNAAAYPNITCVHAALWDEEKELAVVDPGLGHYGFQTAAVATATRPRESVTGVTIPQLMRRYSLSSIDLLKLDIEGAEKEVFEASAPWIDKIGVVVVEMHDRYRTGCSRSTYIATKDFDVEIQNGETVFLLRRSFVPDAAQAAAADEARRRRSAKAATQLPLRILSSN